jgi:hypothetical protein
VAKGLGDGFVNERASTLPASISCQVTRFLLEEGVAKGLCDFSGTKWAVLIHPRPASLEHGVAKGLCDISVMGFASNTGAILVSSRRLANMLGGALAHGVAKGLAASLEHGVIEGL